MFFEALWDLREIEVNMRDFVKHLEKIGFKPSDGSKFSKEYFDIVVSIEGVDFFYNYDEIYDTNHLNLIDFLDSDCTECIDYFIKLNMSGPEHRRTPAASDYSRDFVRSKEMS